MGITLKDFICVPEIDPEYGWFNSAEYRRVDANNDGTGDGYQGRSGVYT